MVSSKRRRRKGVGVVEGWIQGGETSCVFLLILLYVSLLIRGFAAIKMRIRVTMVKESRCV
jgi:hypothetical protein